MPYVYVRERIDQIVFTECDVHIHTMSDKETLNFNMEKKVLIDLDKMGEIKDTYAYVKEDKTELQRLDGVLKSLSADGLVRCDLVLT